MIFIDTGAFLARYLTKDQSHGSALKLWSKIEKTKVKCATSNFVLDETFTLLGRRANYAFAAEKAKLILTSEVFTIARPQLEDELKAIDYFQKFSDKEVSYTDCISFTLMKKLKITTAFTFDKHFQMAGFQVFK